MQKINVFTFFSLLLAVVFAEDRQRVQVDVYYESTCPDSIKFINKQLYPALTSPSTNISRFVELQLIPFGKSSYTKNAVGETEFQCHHGPEECRGNKIHACAIDKIGNVTQPSDGFGYNTVTLDYINCLMKKVDISNRTNVIFPTIECGGQVEKVKNVNEIETCSEHSTGVQLLEHYGHLTDKLQKPLKSVPTVVFNGQYKEEDNKVAQNDFVKVLCQYIKGDKPADCAAKNTAHTSTLAFTTIFTCIAFYFLF